MAPTQPKPSHRTSAPPKSILKSSTTRTSITTQAPHPPKSKTKTASLFPTTKRDKRLIKHAALLSKISKPTTSSNANSRRRQKRPSKTLVTNLDALADALPATTGPTSNTGVDDGTETNGAPSQVNIITRKSMKSKPGALKRQQKLDNAERERFVRNLGQLQGNTGAGGAGEVKTTATATQDRWAALRGFIGETLEKRVMKPVGVEEG